jgi:hypothetical protein
MGRSYEDEPRSVLSTTNSNTEFVDWYACDNGSGGLQCDQGTAISRAFNPSEIACINHHFRNQRDPRLCRWHDNDLAGVRRDTAMLRQMLEQRRL